MFLDLLYQELGDNKPASGGETRFNCQFCGNTKYKFYVHDATGLWQCKVCGEKGNPVSFVMKHFQVTFPDAKDILETYDYEVGEYNGKALSHQKYGVHLTEEEQLYMYIMNQGEVPEEEVRVKYTCPYPPSNCKSLIENFNNPEAFPFFTYLNGRGITLEQIKQHNISYVTDGIARLSDDKELRLINHLVFFAFDPRRKAIYWNTRSIDPKPFIKSLNSPSRENEYSKATVVLNLNNAYKSEKIIIVEGFFNMCTIQDGAVVTYGKQVSNEQIRQILEATRERQTPIYIYLDRDAWKESIKVAEKIKAIEPDRKVFHVYSEDDRDANDIGYDEAWRRINNALPADTEGELIFRMLHL
ncbi:DNA primase [Bacillus phage vB_BcgM]|nr:DNA primase [Bacillus phage vB_BcgM]